MNVYGLPGGGLPGGGEANPYQTLIQSLAAHFGGQAGSQFHGQGYPSPQPIRPDYTNRGQVDDQAWSPGYDGQVHGTPVPYQESQGVGTPPVPHPFLPDTTQLHPLIQQALQHVRMMGQPRDNMVMNLGLHPQVDRYHAINASHELASRMAELTSRSLNRNRGR
jgi:hypothetical protein